MRTDRDSLQEYLGDFDEFDKETLAELRDTLREFQHPTTLERLFDSIREDEEWMDDIIERSYSHDLGFDKLILVSLDDPERKFRLHIWDDEAVPQQATDAGIHNHRWNFCSIVLTGAMEFELFERERGRTVHEYKYTPVGMSSEYSLNELEETELHKTFSGFFRAGMDYEITHDMIHRAYAGTDQPTATLIFQGPECKPKTNVFSEDGIENPDSITVGPVTREEIHDKFSMIVDEMGGSHDSRVNLD